MKRGLSIALAVGSLLAHSGGYPANPKESIRHNHCVYEPFRSDGSGNKVSRYTCERSDITRWALSINCSSKSINYSAPDIAKTPPRELPGGPGMPMRWEGWKKPVIGTEDESVLRKACAQK